MLAKRVSQFGDYSIEQMYARGCIFIHIPKCAGVSVCQSLFGNLGPGHLTLRQHQEVLDSRTFDSMFKFSFVRNPWDRLVSAFYFLKQGGYNEADANWRDIT